MNALLRADARRLENARQKPCPRPPRRVRECAVSAAYLIVAVAVGACGRGGANAVPSPGSRAYTRLVSAFQTGVIALEAGSKADAGAVAVGSFLDATRVAPGEPAAWADLAVARALTYDAASARWDLNRARALAPNSAAVESVYGWFERYQGDDAAAIRRLSRAVSLDPSDLRSRYSLAQALGDQPAGATAASRDLDAILARVPANVAALADYAVDAGRVGNRVSALTALKRMKSESGTWPAAVRAALDASARALQRKSTDDLPGLLVLRNLLGPLPAYRAAHAELQGRILLDRFVREINPPPSPSPPDTSLVYAPRPIPGKWIPGIAALAAVSLNPELPASISAEYHVNPVARTKPSVVAVNAAMVQIHFPSGGEYSMPFPGGGVPPNANSIAALDSAYRFRMDIAVAGRGGFRLYRQLSPGRFQDGTSTLRLASSIVNRAYYGVWPVDLGTDGDLSLLLAPVTGEPVVLRNNGDGTVTPTYPFAGVDGARSFVWSDLTGDGAADAAFVDARGRLAVFINERDGHFRLWNHTPNLGKLVALAAASLGNHRGFDLTALRTDGAILRIDRTTGGMWSHDIIARWSALPSDGSAQLIWADLDNNGACDLIATCSRGTGVWLQGEGQSLVPLRSPILARDVSVGARQADGRIALLGAASAGRPVVLTGRGSRSYGWVDIDPRATFVPRSHGASDNRINSFGIGGEIELRAGLLDSAQPIAGPTIRFGLGDYHHADAVRILWPNGTPRAQFNVASGARLVVEQRLAGWCP